MRAVVIVLLLSSVAAAQPSEQSEIDRRAEAQRTCAARDPKCDWIATFSSLERASILRALAARALLVEPSPWGKVIGKIHIYNEDVFAEDNWLQFFNFIHYTTREHAVRQELTIDEGELWNDDLIAESSRRLRDPLYSSVVAILPVKTAEAGKVDVLVVTRDVWSLRFNSQYSFQEGSLTNLRISISENNFLGHRNLLAAALAMDQGAVAVGPVFIDKNVAGTHLYLYTAVDEVVTRQSLNVFDPRIADPTMSKPSGDPHGIEDGGGFHHEGSDSNIQLLYPLWSLASEWGGGVTFAHNYGVSRSLLFTGLRGIHETASDGTEVLLPREYARRAWTTNAYVVRQWGTWLKQSLGFGMTVSSVKPSLLASFPSDVQLQQEFERDVFPRSEVISAPNVEYHFYMPRYTTLRDFTTYDLAEDTQIGPDADLNVAEALHVLGSDSHFTAPSVSAGWTFPWCRDGFVRIGGGFSLRIQHADSHGRYFDTIDNTANAQIRAATPIYQYVRFVAQASMATRWHDTQNNYYTLGSDSGLRGYAIAQFSGQRVTVGQLEARSIPWPIWVLRVGGVAFYEAGGASNSFGTLSPLYQDVGFGIRALIPQTSRDLFRFDVAFPLVAAPFWPAFHPQITAGFGSYF